jgi:hypothetical protein
MRLTTAVLSVLAVWAAVAPAARFPSIGGDSHPATLANGDGSAVIGGLDGTGERDSLGHVQLGHIRWTTWTRQHAVGWGVEWERCIDVRGCPAAYTLTIRKPFRIVASYPVRDVFRRLKAFGCEVWRGAGVGYYPVSCRTWR